jgi:hypothetical protein
MLFRANPHLTLRGRQHTTHVTTRRSLVVSGADNHRYAIIPTIHDQGFAFLVVISTYMPSQAVIQTRETKHEMQITCSPSLHLNLIYRH